MFKFELINIPEKLKIEEKIISSIFVYISEIITKKQNWTLNIVFITDEEIKNLNNTYRKKNKTTDVLSFHYFEDFSDLKEDDIAGEIVISKEKIFSQALEFWIKNEEEFYKLLIHSILHILWYDHEIEEEFLEMQKLENKITEKIFKKLFSK